MMQVAVVKFWAYQAYQLQLIVYTKLTLMLHGLELFSSGIRQWGNSTHGWVSFPIMFTSYRLIITNHQGTAFYDSKPRESGTLGGFTLDVGSNNEVSMDAYWIAIGL